MTVPNKTLTAVPGREIGMGHQTFGDLSFDRLRQKLARAIAQHFGKRIGKLSRLAQGDNLIVLHGVSILFWMCGWLVTATIRRLPYSSPSPTLPHSSALAACLAIEIGQASRLKPGVQRFGALQPAPASGTAAGHS
jgi:hypothetical protein